MDSIDFSCHEALFNNARKSGSKISKKQKQHKNTSCEVIHK
jgi:hypothetical protein